MRRRDPKERRAPRRGAAPLCLALLLAVLMSLPGGAAAQQPGGGGPPADMSVAVSVSLSASTTTIPWGWNAIVVSVTNSSSGPARGEATVLVNSYGDRRSFQVRAPYAVAAGTTVSVQLPVDVPSYAGVNVLVVDAARGELISTTLSNSDAGGVTLLDVSGSQLKAAINDTPVITLYEEPSHSGRGSGSGTTVSVLTPRVDGATGDPVLPERAALYNVVDAVLLRSETLARLTGPQLEALSGYVLAGGTLAIAITRPEDARSPAVTAFAGGEVTRTSVSSEALRPLVLASPSVKSTGHDVPVGLAPGEELGTMLSGYAGGNLRGTSYGNSASYGLGEVHLLAFDPTHKPAIDDSWAKVRVLDMARRAYDRRISVVFRPGEREDPDRLQQVRKQLDPNESSRWAVGAAAVLLLVYAVLAGPVNYSIAARRNKPLSAIRMLPIFSAITFFIIVGIGVTAKGVSGRARHLSLVEAGAGMPRATIHRYRGFYASRAKELTVRTSDTSSVVSTALTSEPGEVLDRLVVDREGARLENVSALPWQTLVMREDGAASIGEGVSILKQEPAGVTIKNRSGHDLRGALLRLPGGEVRYFTKIEDGAAVGWEAGREVGATMKDRPWISAIGATHSVGAMRARKLGAYALGPILEGDAPGLAAAWQAIEEAARNDVSWFLDDVPVLLAQMDGGEGKSSDSGLRLESDRLLIRVVGYGGAP